MKQYFDGLAEFSLCIFSLYDIVRYAVRRVFGNFKMLDEGTVTLNTVYVVTRGTQ